MIGKPIPTAETGNSCTNQVGETSHACCAPEGQPLTESVCPACGEKGTAVPSITLQSLLKDSRGTDLRETPYRFCANPGCEVVYFAQDGSQPFYRQDLAVRVGVKETSSPRPLCYCFGHSVESLMEEWHSMGRITALETLRAEIKAGTCRCESVNPSGRCCLGEVSKVVKEIQTGQLSPTGASDDPDGSEDSSCCR